ncbi:MAG: WD40 repeat domain-containing protein [Flavobacteriales bacterium]
MQLEKIFELIGHSASVYALEKGLNGNEIFSGSGDKIVTAWDTEKQSNISFTIKTNSPVIALKHIEKHKLLLVGLFNGNLHVINTQDKKEVKFLPYHKEGVFHIEYDEKSDRIFLLSGDGTVSAWDSNFKPIKALALGSDKIRSMSIHKDLNLAAFATGDGLIKIMKLSNFEITYEIPAHDKVNVVKFHPEKKVLMSGGKDAFLKVWNIEHQYQNIISIPAHNWAIYGIEFSSDNKHFITCSRDKTIKLWDAKTLDLLERVDYKSHRGHTHSVNCIYWPEGKDYFISGGDDKRIIGWKLRS